MRVASITTALLLVAAPGCIGLGHAQEVPVIDLEVSFQDDKNDALLIELQDFSGSARCLTDLDDDGQSDPVADPIRWIFENSFESGDTSGWSFPARH